MFYQREREKLRQPNLSQDLKNSVHKDLGQNRGAVVLQQEQPKFVTRRKSECEQIIVVVDM